ncbi:MAG: hypothetical protein IKV13_00255 [Akkermansia sp.]|nr:hypothetical protein [Akkermansia sp.]
MQSSIVGKIFSVLLLIVLCFLLGSLGADSAKSAVAAIVVGVAVFAVLFLGKNCWVLIFLLAPLSTFISPSKLSKFSIDMLIGNGILLYWVLLWGMGYVKFRWRSMLWLDLPILGILIYLIATYLRYPVSIQLLGLSTDRMGGTPYVVFISGILLYVALSSIPMEMHKLRQVLEWTAALTLVGHAVGCVLHLMGYNVLPEAALDRGTFETAYNTRFVAFIHIGVFGILYIYAKFPLKRILQSPPLVLLLLFCFAGVIISSFRARFASLMVTLMAMAVVKREVTALICMGIFGICGIYVLNAADMTKELPVGLQRIVNHLPGVTVSGSVARKANSSMEWRYELWSYALDPRTGAIKDYIWGDGMGFSYTEQRRASVALGHIRGLWYGKIYENTMRGKVWHNSLISSIQVVGIVGLSIMLFIYLVVFISIFRVAISAPDNQMRFLSLFFLFPQFLFLEDIITGGTPEILFFIYDMVIISYLKMMYCFAREEGWLRPLFARHKYEPMMLYDYKDRLKPVE